MSDFIAGSQRDYDVITPQVVIRENRELYDLLDSMRSIILYLDDWGMVVHGNSRARRWRVDEDLIGKNFFELAGGWDDPSECQREVMQVIRTGKPMLNSLERASEHGEERWFSVDKIPIKGDDGRVTGALLVMTDITEGVNKERELQKSEDRYRAFIGNSFDAIWSYDLSPPVDTSLPQSVQVDQILRRAVLVEYNDRLKEMLGVDSSADLIGLPLLRSGDFQHQDNVNLFVEQGYRLEAYEISRVDEHGQVLTMQMSVIGFVENGFLVRTWGTTRDVTDNKRYLDRLEYLANHDPLTSLPNRTLFYKRMRESLEGSGASRRMALLLIDLDRFKEINDTLGHIAGDKVLKQLGPRLEVELGDTPGMVARLGGDEFAIFLPNIRNPQHGIVMAHRFLDCVCQVFEIEGVQTEISASIGVALAPDHANDASTLMRYADVAMYHAKHRLKGISLYDSEFDSHTPKRLALMGALGAATREDQLFLQYQPKVDLSTGEAFGFEALIRWNHPTMGFVPPSEFVPIAEMSSLIYAMSSWVLEQTIKQCAKWRDQGYDMVCAMNLSARNLLDDRIVTDLKRFLDKYQLSGSSLEMEITESTLMSDPERAEAALEKIDKLGVSLAIDDFGTGYSSLAYLKRLPVKTLKIDGSFVQNMLTDDQDEIIVHSTIQLAHNLGLSIVAEGVETDDVYKRLKELGCDKVQGYYIAKPLDADKVVDWMGESTWSSYSDASA